MPSIHVKPLQEDVPFGARISGLTRQALSDPGVRAQLREELEACGLLYFEAVEQSSEMQVELSNVFGPPKLHPVKAAKPVDDDPLPGLIQITADPVRNAVVEVAGRPRVAWQPWHFDHSYTSELNRAGVLRPIQLPPEDGDTGFADGIQLYRALSPELRQRIEGCHILYSLDLLYAHMRFGVPEDFRVLNDNSRDILDEDRATPRAVHPAVWTRRTGEKVLHISGWGCHGIEGRENADGDALFEAVCREMLERMQPYVHVWKPDDMLVWDNWRMLHAGFGCDPGHARRLHRTTIAGDYGLGRWEGQEPHRTASAAS